MFVFPYHWSKFATCYFSADLNFLPKQNEIEILILKDSSPQAGIEQFKHCQIDIPIEDENNGTNDTMDNHFEDWFDQENTHIHLAEYEIKRIE